MRAELRYLHSPDCDDLEAGPSDPANFGILVQAMIGPSGPEGGEESFDFVLCTPPWLAEQLRGHASIWGRRHLIVARYDHEVLRGAVLDLCSRAEGDDWAALAEQIGRFTTWEFEDYVE